MRFYMFLFCVKLAYGNLWKNGIVHYSISNKDFGTFSDKMLVFVGLFFLAATEQYAHSQDIIITTLSKLQNEVCVKFFHAPFNFNSTNDKILYINNAEKKKTCSPLHFDYHKNVIDMQIGYKCMNEKDIAGIVVDMLKASIKPTGASINSYDLIKKFEETESNLDTLITAKDKNFINLHYQKQCLQTPSYIVQRRSENGTDALQLSNKNVEYYNNKLWPLGIVLYGIDKEFKFTQDYETLKEAMDLIELSTCVVFQEYIADDVLVAKSYLWFGVDGHDMPVLGFFEGKQNLKLSSFTRGAPGHTAHTVNNLLRALGIHMMSNRFDRDNHIVVNWKNVEKGKEQYLEKAPESAWLVHIPYDFNSITHAPANYMCSNCDLGATTVQPIQDHLWQRTMSMGHINQLSPSDVQLISILYSKQCRNRYITH